MAPGSKPHRQAQASHSQASHSQASHSTLDNYGEEEWDAFFVRTGLLKGIVYEGGLSLPALDPAFCIRTERYGHFHQNIDALERTAVVRAERAQTTAEQSDQDGYKRGGNLHGGAEGIAQVNMGINASQQTTSATSMGQDDSAESAYQAGTYLGAYLFLSELTLDLSEDCINFFHQNFESSEERFEKFSERFGHWFQKKPGIGFVREKGASRRLHRSSRSSNHGRDSTIGGNAGFSAHGAGADISLEQSHATWVSEMRDTSQENQQDYQFSRGGDPLAANDENVWKAANYNPEQWNVIDHLCLPENAIGVLELVKLIAKVRSKSSEKYAKIHRRSERMLKAIRSKSKKEKAEAQRRATKFSFKLLAQIDRQRAKKAEKGKAATKQSWTLTLSTTETRGIDFLLLERMDQQSVMETYRTGQRHAFCEVDRKDRQPFTVTGNSSSTDDRLKAEGPFRVTLGLSVHWELLEITSTSPWITIPDRAQRQNQEFWMRFKLGERSYTEEIEVEIQHISAKQPTNETPEDAEVFVDTCTEAGGLGTDAHMYHDDGLLGYPQYEPSSTSTTPYYYTGTASPTLIPVDASTMEPELERGLYADNQDTYPPYTVKMGKRAMRSGDPQPPHEPALYQYHDSVAPVVRLPQRSRIPR